MPITIKKYFSIVDTSNLDVTNLYKYEEKMTLIHSSKVIIGILMFCAFHLAHANSSIPLSDYFKDAWSTQEGLPHNSINAIAQTSDGYLWFATWEGVARYNGRDFRFYERSKEKGILDSGLVPWCLIPIMVCGLLASEAELPIEKTIPGSHTLPLLAWSTI